MKFLTRARIRASARIILLLTVMPQCYFNIIFSFCRRAWTDTTRVDSMTDEAVNMAKKLFICESNGDRTRRMFWASVAIRAILLSLKNKNGLAKDHVNYLKACFAATTDEYLTVYEVRGLLYACFRVLDKLELFDAYCQKFDKLMPECPVVLEPRKLADLARCQVRQTLIKSNLPLPFAVEELPLPVTLKSFVLGNIIDNSISRKRKRDSSEEAVGKEKFAKLFE